MPVVDSQPHFFYTLKDGYLSPCSVLGRWSTYFRYAPEWDVLFALNPVTSQLCVMQLLTLECE
jgi:hypothetical protein